MSLEGPYNRDMFNYGFWLKDGIFAIVCLAWIQAECLDEDLLQRVDSSVWHDNAYPLLLSMDQNVLRELVSGNIAAAEMRGDIVLPDAWKNIIEDNDAQAPCIYARILSNETTGDSPTGTQLLRVTDLLRKYCSRGDKYYEDAHRIDNATGARCDEFSSKGGSRFYLTTKEGRLLRSRREQVLTFCDSVDERIAAIPKKSMDEPIKRAFHYIGYTMQYKSRHAAHRADDGHSSFLMNLFHVACIVALPNTGNWVLRDRPLAFCATPVEIGIGELLLTLLSDALHEAGGGFAVCRAELSGLNQNMMAQAWIQIWENATNFREFSTPFRANVDQQLDLERQLSKTDVDLETQRANLEKKKAHIQELDDELATKIQQMELEGMKAVNRAIAKVN
jgi:hypothetical protein